MRAGLIARLEAAARRSHHLRGMAVPHLVLRSTSGQDVALDELGPRRAVLYIYPLSGRPGVDLPDGWDAIPGARGCTPEACGFRDHHAELLAAGAGAVFGLSSQSTDYQAELADRLALPFAIRRTPPSRWPRHCACRHSAWRAGGCTGV